MYIQNQVFTVVGISVSGKSAAEALLARGAKVYIYDDSKLKRTQKAMLSLCEKGAVAAENVEDAIDASDVVVVSPGVPIDSPFLVAARKKGKRIIGELELGFTLARGTFVAVTGTNGKTTTCSLIYHVLKTAGKKAELVGNIGTPVCERLDSLAEDVIAVTEVSSFQLETVRSFCPHVAVVLNITPDHLDRHYTMENYVYLKKRILANLRESEYAVLNYDDPVVRDFSLDARAKTVFFSTAEQADAVYKDGGFYWKGEMVASGSDLILAGEHNKQNALAAIAVLKLLGVENSDVKKGFASFKGVKHRTELIYAKNGVKYFNDSKSTNVDSTIKAIDVMTEPTVIILGGKDKNLDYTALFEKLRSSCVVHAVLMGENRYKMLDYANKVGFFKISVSSSFETAVRIAKIEARNNGAVLLSPACASFDMFTDYEERGREFERIVKAINE